MRSECTYLLARAISGSAASLRRRPKLCQDPLTFVCRRFSRGDLAGALFFPPAFIIRPTFARRRYGNAIDSQ